MIHRFREFHRILCGSLVETPPLEVAEGDAEHRQRHVPTLKRENTLCQFVRSVIHRRPAYSLSGMESLCSQSVTTDKR